MFHIVFEGPDGSGKSTMARMLAAELKRTGVKVNECHQPGGSKISDEIRKIFKGVYGKPSSLTLFYLAVADHMDYIYNLSHLKHGYSNDTVLIQDRHSAISGYAYQVHGGGINPKVWAAPYMDKAVATEHTPDMVMLYVPKLATILKRIDSRGEAKDHFEKEEFLKKVLAGYKKVAEEGVFDKKIYRFSTGEASIQTEYLKLIKTLASTINEKKFPELKEIFVRLYMAYTLKNNPLQLPKV
jgi:dTMP kinase